MKEELFRKKSIDRMKSPESLDDYIQVSNPSVWVLLISIIVLLAGACVWGIFGHIDSTIDTRIQVQSGMAACIIETGENYNLQNGMTVRFNDYEAQIAQVSQVEGGYICYLNLNQQVPDGFYEGKVVINSIKPISFIFN